MLKVTCSGAFRNNGEMNDFSDFEMIMPDCPDEWIKSNCINRCFVRMGEKAFKKRIDSIHSLYIDNVERNYTPKDKDGKAVKLKPSCCGKKIKSLTWEELQDLAIMFCLREIPLYREGDLRWAREIAYKEYCSKIAGQKLNDGFNFAMAVDFDIPDEAAKVAEYKGNAKEVLAGKDIEDKL